MIGLEGLLGESTYEEGKVPKSVLQLHHDRYEVSSRVWEVRGIVVVSPRFPYPEQTCWSH